MAVKAKKRKIAVSLNKERERKGSQNKVEVDLLREEEEMLAMTRLLKQVDESQAVTVTKQMLEATNIDSNTSTSSDVNTSDAIQAPNTEDASLAASSSSSDLAASSSKARKSNTKVTARSTRRKTTLASSMESTSSASLSVATSSISTSGSASNASSSKEKPESERWLADLTVANMQKQNRAHEQEDQRRLQEKEAAMTTSSTTGAATDVNGVVSNGLTASQPKQFPFTTRVSRYRKNQPSQVISSAMEDAEKQQQSESVTSSASRQSAPSVASDSAPGNVASEKSDGSLEPGSLTFAIKPEGLSISPGFDIPLSALSKQRITNALISKKARSIYAPEAAKAIHNASPDQPKRRPGRPPGYFLGPTSCAFCRQQHRRCDYNAVCHRCLKAKIPCDRSGTVERPTIIVREARLQAKAEAAAVLAAAVAAGIAVAPEPKPRPSTRPSSALRSPELEIAAESSTSPSRPSTSAHGMKRRRSPSSGAVSKDNIIEEKVKRVASVRAVQKYDPSTFFTPRGRPFSRPRRGAGKNVTGDSSSATGDEAVNDSLTDKSEAGDSMESADMIEPGTEGSNSAAVVRKSKSVAQERVVILPVDTTGRRKPGRPPGGKFAPTTTHLTPANQAEFLRARGAMQPNASANASMPILKRGPGRPPWKVPPLEPVIKRPVGRPPNSVRYALNPSLIPPPKLVDPNAIKRGPGRPPRTSTTASASAASVRPLVHTSTQLKTADHSRKVTGAKATSSVVPLKRNRDSSVDPRANSSSAHVKNLRLKQVACDAFSSNDDDAASISDEPTTKPSTRLARKVYLKSGLYSSDLKVSSVAVPDNAKVPTTIKSGRHSTRSNALTVGSRRGSSASSSGSTPFFQLPINYGAVLMSRQKDFCLPFDIMQAWHAGLLRKTMQPEPFVKIRSNVFVERKRRTETSPMVCHCTPPPPGSGKVGCGEDCYNRVMFYECVVGHCPCGDLCSNRRFQQKHDDNHLRVIWTKERGFGIQTATPIKKGSLVIEYRGEVISQIECHKRMEGIYKNNKNFYFLEYEKGEVVDACQKGTIARFVNHSCSPNSQIEKWYLNGEMSIGIFASQDILPGAEISYDYNFSSFRGAQKQKCRCGAPNCRGYIGERSSKNKETATVVPNKLSGKKGDGRKQKAGRRRVQMQETPSLRFGQMPSVRQIRQRQSAKYTEAKMAAIRYTKLFLFRNTRLVESKYIKYAQTKSRSYQETFPRLTAHTRQRRKRSLEEVMDDLRAAVQAGEEAAMEQFAVNVDDSVIGDDSSDPSTFASTEGSIVLEVDEDDADAMDGFEMEQRDLSRSVDSDEDQVDELESDSDEEHQSVHTTASSEVVYETVEWEEYELEDDEDNGNDADEDKVDAEDPMESEDDQEMVTVATEMDVIAIKSSKSRTVARISGTAKPVANGIDALESVTAEEPSPSSTRGSSDTLVGETNGDEVEKTLAKDKSEKDHGPRRLRNRIL
ncbi:Histone-Lysine N-Methyltransferase ash1l [Mortierella sp. GBA30]|nr:Histone-Lysine N-Methyltransferase ash1l [Mortierella sp. GBA30]